MTLHVQSYLRGGGTLDALLATYAIKHRRHERYPNLVLLKYNQIESPFAEPIVRECRGIILDEQSDWCVVSRAFDKFFNHGEALAADIDWSTARVQEKVDGSLCVVYAYDGAWHVATTGTPDASGDINGSGTRFADLFWSTLRPVTSATDLFPPTDCGVCFFFELTSPQNRVVVVHTEASLTFLGARHLTDGEISWKKALSLLPWARAVSEHPLQSLADIGKSFETLSPLKTEGYVVVDAAFNRIKVKHPGYVALHHAKDGLTQRAFVEIARKGEVSEVLTAFPEFRPLLDDATRRLDALTLKVEADYARLMDIPEQKAFAFEALKTRCSSALFAVRAKKALSVRDFFAKQPIDALMRLLGYKDAIIPKEEL